MGLLFEIAVLVLLLAIVAELHALRSGIARLPALVRASDEKKDSPTINVNVGTLPLQPAKEGEAASPAPQVAETAVVAEEPPVSGEEGEPVADNEPEPEPVPEPPRRADLGYRAVAATPSGLLAVKCPACQAENSSYRNECFNCGAALH